MHRIIDWNELWKAIHAASPGRDEKDRDPAAIWDKRAAAYQRVTRDETKATEQELAVIEVRPDDTVLDVGAGTGRLAVPLARRVLHVTALDPSGGMLAALHDRMGRAGQGNYSCIRMRWEDAVIKKDVNPHDIVIAAFSLGFYDLAAALHKLDAAALRSVYLFWHAGEWRSPEEMELYRAVFGEDGSRKGYPDYIYPVNILHDAGIFPDVRIYQAVWTTVYDSVSEAVATWVAMHKPDQEDLTPVRDHFSRILQRDEAGKYIEMSFRPTAAVWWTKEKS